MAVLPWDLVAIRGRHEDLANAFGNAAFAFPEDAAAALPHHGRGAAVPPPVYAAVAGRGV